MEKTLFEQMGETYHEENGYLIPDLTLHPKKKNLSGYGDSGICGI